MMTLLLTTLALAPLQCELSVSAESGVNEPLPGTACQAWRAR